MTADRVAAAAAEVRKYWRDWPQERRDSVRALSGFLADAIEELVNAVAESPRGRCGVCERHIALTKNGVLRQHNGDVWDGQWRQMCEGTGQLPEVGS